MELNTEMLLAAKEKLKQSDHGFPYVGQEVYGWVNGETVKIVWTEWDEARVKFNERYKGD